MSSDMTRRKCRPSRKAAIGAQGSTSPAAGQFSLRPFFVVFGAQGKASVI